nr:type II toxin-antitoxin system Phd/YefM family antitoxin [Nocardia carnea]
MKSISVGELRQNPSAMIADVEAGEVYELTRHHHRVGYIVPAVSSTQIIPRAVDGGARTSSIARHELRTAGSIEELLDSEKGEW